MQILFLGPNDSALLPWLRAQENSVVQHSERLSSELLSQLNADFLISYGYRHILSEEILAHFPERAINLHISLLPWNRGADPNLWSFLENSPKGVSIHYIDPGLDTGDIIVQQACVFDEPDETLASSYAKLHRSIQELFKLHWAKIKTGNCPREAQQGKGSFHTSKDKEAFSRLLTNGWDTPVRSLEGQALKDQP